MAAFETGDKVIFGDRFRIRATVIGKRARGYRIEYWGQGARDGELIRETVPARDLTPICPDFRVTA
ncbi:TPA: hypothetical protein L5P37_002274 [Pseudomonas aeruginosa]|nr:hypothetical protein [Pseudomonas aeruginosa]